MTPPDHPGFDLDIGMGIDVDVTVGQAGGETEAEEGGQLPRAYLVKFEPDVTATVAESVLGRLSPPEEGIVLAGQGAVVVRACRPFVHNAKVTDSVALVHPVRTGDWKPNRHRVRAKDG